MRNKFGTAATYSTPASSLGHSRFPSLSFYSRFLLSTVFPICRAARHGRMDDERWITDSAKCADLLEENGVRFEIEGIDILQGLTGPFVIVANHMSTLETFVLPALLRPYFPITYVVKRTLVDVPFFGYVMRSRDPVTVGRSNPREDLQAVLDGGCARLRRGISVVVFPQSTRSLDADISSFNSIGVKLARKAGKAVLPIALKTDAWGVGRGIKEFGKIRPQLPVRIRIGQPVRITDPKACHREVVSFICEAVNNWQIQDGSAQNP